MKEVKRGRPNEEEERGKRLLRCCSSTATHIAAKARTQRGFPLIRQTIPAILPRTIVSKGAHVAREDTARSSICAVASRHAWHPTARGSACGIAKVLLLLSLLLVLLLLMLRKMVRHAAASAGKRKLAVAGRCLLVRRWPSVEEALEARRCGLRLVVGGAVGVAGCFSAAAAVAAKGH